MNRQQKIKLLQITLARRAVSTKARRGQPSAKLERKLLKMMKQISRLARQSRTEKLRILKNKVKKSALNNRIFFDEVRDLANKDARYRDLNEKMRGIWGSLEVAVMHLTGMRRLGEKDRQNVMVDLQRAFTRSLQAYRELKLLQKQGF